MTCEHNKTVQIFGSVFKCSQCGKVYDNDDDTLRPDTDHYQRLQESKEHAKRRAIERNRRRR